MQVCMSNVYVFVSPNLSILITAQYNFHLTNKGFISIYIQSGYVNGNNLNFFYFLDYFIYNTTCCTKVPTYFSYSLVADNNVFW